MTAQSDLYRLLKKPVITEKTTTLMAMNQYVFEVVKTANKVELAKAFELAFPGRRVDAVRLIKVPARTKRIGRRTGRIAPKLKAVFSITGEPIELLTGV